MADEKPSLHVDTDWKKQAQEEKRKLAEKEQKQRAAEPPRPAAAAASGATTASAAPGQGGQATQQRRQLHPASFASLVQTVMTQALYYLGDLAGRGGQGMVDLDMAKHQVDTLAVLEEKTKNNLTDDEKRLLDTALYEVRMRYVSVASQFQAP
jgi:hypothetical protein